MSRLKRGDGLKRDDGLRLKIMGGLIRNNGLWV